MVYPDRCLHPESGHDCFYSPLVDVVDEESFVDELPVPPDILVGLLGTLDVTDGVQFEA